MTVKILADELPADVQTFLADRRVSYGAIGHTAAGIELAGLVDQSNGHVDGVPARVAQVIATAAAKAGASGVFEITTGSPGGRRTLTRSEFERLDHHARAEAMRAGTRLVEG